MADKIIIAQDTLLAEVQSGLRNAIKETTATGGRGVDIASLADELRKCERALGTRGEKVPEEERNPVLSKVQQDLLAAFHHAAKIKDNPGLAALSKQLRKYERALNKGPQNPLTS